MTRFALLFRYPFTIEILEMDFLPDLFDANDALYTFNKTANPSKPLLAKIVVALDLDGYKNSQIREDLGIDHDYEVSQLKRAGTYLSRDQLDLWHNNQSRIKLGHIRAICANKPEVRDGLLRSLLTRRITVAELEALAANKGVKETDKWLSIFAEKMSEVTGRIIKMSYDNKTEVGKVTLSWHGYDDLEEIAKKFGFDQGEHL